MSSVNFMSDNESKILVDILGILSVFSTVKVDLKRLFNSSADSVSDVVMEPSDFCIVE